MTAKIQIQYEVLSLSTQNTKPQSINLRVSELNHMHIIHRALIKQIHEKRQGNAHCKTRSEIRGGGKKPWKQKGTGKARVGSIRSPLWKGGGVIFGPKSKKYKQKLNKKEQKLALRNLLYNKKENIVVIDSLSMQIDKPNTKFLLSKISQLKIGTQEKVLIIVAKKNINLYLSTRNLKNIELVCANQISTESLITNKHLVIEAQALKIIERVYNEKQTSTRTFNDY